MKLIIVFCISVILFTVLSNMTCRDAVTFVGYDNYTDIIENDLDCITDMECYELTGELEFVQ